MRQLLCKTCGSRTLTSREDAINGIIPRRIEGIITRHAVCDICNKQLIPSDYAVALSYPRYMRLWESDYFNLELDEANK